ncbi:hypothetical protein GQX74_000187 [Glossina fuscipes]|nr:hypothetical protein GQX74_000187 [Glossina fuscipes]
MKNNKTDDTYTTYSVTIKHTTVDLLMTDNIFTNNTQRNSTNAEIFASPIKEPLFWPEVWSIQAESQFAPKGVTQNITKRRNILWKSMAVKNIEEHLQAPPKSLNRYCWPKPKII